MADLDNQINESNDRIMKRNKESQVLGAQVAHLTRLKDEVRRCFKQAAKKSIMQELRAELKQEAEAQEKKMQEEQERSAMEKNRELNKIDARGESDKVAQLTRLKPSGLRSTEEKSWVALDLLVNPVKYVGLG